ncbi:3-hydroxyacyl-CoA dehydrogenase NAD-binding domain-containing protein [Parablastomonas sp. CN1-191]|uniref:3-hydroxyacyl-CoA dehydrogenase n=1 Tax=Parablastomonas sp. CN1-191 TaxID=3400908 RepID=UPI003BF7BB53
MTSSETLPGAKAHIDTALAISTRIDDLPAGTPLKTIGRVGVLGAGTMGGGIAMNFLTAGIPVTIVEAEAANLERGVATIRRNYENSVKRGKMEAAAVDAAMAVLTPSLDFADLSQCDLVIEAVYENLDLKKDIFRRLDQVAKRGAILASNTSYLDIDAMAAETSRPEAVLGMHFFSPANIMKLLEVVRAEKTGMSELATVMDLASRIGKVAVVAGVCHGFIGNRMLMPRQLQAQAMLMEGADYAAVDQALLDFGFPMGPFQMSDLAGVDIGWHRDPARIESIRDALCAAGRWGQKTGKGWYDYDDSRQRRSSDEVHAIVAKFAAREGKPQRAFTADEIRERLLYPMIDEGAKILGEGKAQRASDIDLVWLNGYGWPAWTGGPMFWAQHVGLKTIVAGLERHGMPVSPYLRQAADGTGKFD